MSKRRDNRAWFLVLPVFLLVAFSAFLPLMTVVNYSVQDISGDRRLFVGLDLFREILRRPEYHAAFLRQLLFSFCVLAIEIPLGIIIALSMPRRGYLASASLVILAIPLLIPWNVVGTIWQIFARTDIGLGGVLIKQMGFDYNYSGDALHAWLTVLVMDVWHWTPLAALMAYAGLRAIPDVYYQAARIDGAGPFAVFRHIQLPKLRSVLVITILLRFMDSFMIYTEVSVVTGGGPGDATTFLSQFLTTLALGQFAYGRAAAFSLVYYMFILLICYVFYNFMMSGQDQSPGARAKRAVRPE